jgi:hypothetical protein
MQTTFDFLVFTKYCVIVVAIVMTALTILGVFAIQRDGEQAIKPMLHLIVQGDALRMLTVIFIVSAASGLVILGKVDGQLGGTILSGVAGYVLGSGSRRPTRQTGQLEPVQTRK